MTFGAYLNVAYQYYDLLLQMHTKSLSIASCDLQRTQSLSDHRSQYHVLQPITKIQVRFTPWLKCTGVTDISTSFSPLFLVSVAVHPDHTRQPVAVHRYAICHHFPLWTHCYLKQPLQPQPWFLNSNQGALKLEKKQPVIV